MPGKKLPQILEKDLPISFTDKPVTPFGGLTLVARFFCRIGLDQMLDLVLPDEKKSNNSIPASTVVMSFFVEVLRDSLPLPYDYPIPAAAFCLVHRLVGVPD